MKKNIILALILFVVMLGQGPAVADIFAPGGVTGGSNHNMLSATHSDSTPASGVNGDTVIFNSTWQRLPIGTNGQCLVVTGLLPVWGSCAASTAPATVPYWTAAADGTLTSEKDLSALATGLVINTAGTPSAYAGVTCTNQVLRVLSASGAGTCLTITSAYVDTSIAVTSASSSWGDGVTQTFNPNNTNSGLNVGGNASQPSSPVNGDIFYNSGGAVFNFYEAGAWRGLGIASEVLDLQGTFALGKSITGANSRANAFRFGDGVTPMCGWTDATLGPMIRACTDANNLTIIASTFTYKIWDEAGALSMEEIKPSGASPSLMWTYQNAAYRPKKQVWIPAGASFGDGTQCPAAPSTVTINSGAPRATFICGDNDASTIYSEVEMPDSWDGGTVTLMGSFIQTAADTSAINADIAMACRVSGDTINNTWGTEVAMDITNVGGSNKINTVTTAAITPNGTCTGAGTLLQIRYQVDAAGTTTGMTTFHHLGFKLTYSEKSRSS